MYFKLAYKYAYKILFIKRFCNQNWQHMGL